MEVLTGPIEQARGVIGRYPARGERYVFEFGTVKHRRFHMIGVNRPIRIKFYRGETLVGEAIMRPWVGTAAARCDRAIETRP